MKHFLRTRRAYFALASAGLVIPALWGICTRGWGGGVLGAGFAQWCVCAVCVVLLCCGALWARRRQQEWLPGAGMMWALTALSVGVCSAFMLSSLSIPSHLPLSVVVTMGCICLMWALLRHVSLVFWWVFLSLEMMQCVGYYMYGSRINSLVLAETFEASSDEAFAYLESANLLYFIGSILAGILSCVLIWRVMRGQRALPLVNFSLLCGAIACIYGASLPEAPSWRQRDTYWPVMETGEICAAGAEALFHNHATIRQVEGLASPSDEESSLGTLQGNEGVVLVVHIGESVRADRMSLNGYERDTTPWLRTQSSLVNFPNCISAACDTCQAQIAILTDARRDIYEKDPLYLPHTGSVLDLFVKHGFKMYSFFGRRSATHLKYDRVVRILTSQAEERFHAPGSPWTSVPQMADVLRRTDPKQNLIIFINNEGSHTPFEHYDRESPPFMPIGGKFENPSAHAAEVNNAYDATVHYTDEFVRRVVQQLKGRPWIYLYVSDHGEYLGHDGIWGRAGLGESNRNYHSTTGCRVGMFVLASPDFTKLHPHFEKALSALNQHRELCVGHEHIFHTLLGLFDLHTPWYAPSLDLSGSQVQPYTGPKPAEAKESNTPQQLSEIVCKGSPYKSTPTDWLRNEWANGVSLEELTFSPKDAEVVLQGFRMREKLWKPCEGDACPAVLPGTPGLRVLHDKCTIGDYAVVRGVGLVWGADEDRWVLPEEENTPFWDTINKYVEMLPGGSSYSLRPREAESADASL